MVCRFVTLGKGDPGGEDVVRLEAEMDLAKGDETAHQKSGGYEKRERKRDFCDDEGVAEFSVTETARKTFARIAQRLIQIFASGFHCGNQSEKERG